VRWALAYFGGVGLRGFGETTGAGFLFTLPVGGYGGRFSRLGGGGNGGGAGRGAGGSTLISPSLKSKPTGIMVVVSARVEEAGVSVATAGARLAVQLAKASNAIKYFMPLLI